MFSHRYFATGVSLDKQAECQLVKANGFQRRRKRPLLSWNEFFITDRRLYSGLPLLVIILLSIFAHYVGAVPYIIKPFQFASNP